MSGSTLIIITHCCFIVVVQHEVASLKQTISDMEVQAGLDQATQHALQKQLEAAVVAQVCSQQGGQLAILSRN